MKIFLLGGIFLLFVAIGVYIYSAFKARKRFFADLLQFCSHLSIEISFSKNTIARVIERYSQSYSRPFRAVLEGYTKFLNEKQDITRETLIPLMWNRLTLDEAAQTVEFFYQLGRHGSFEEGKKLESTRVEFENMLEKATHDLTTRASIYLKLCIILGIGAVIVLI